MSNVTTTAKINGKDISMNEILLEKGKAKLFAFFWWWIFFKLWSVVFSAVVDSLPVDL